MKIVAVFIVCLFCATLTFAAEWQVIKSQHFLVYYVQDKAFAGDVSRSAERYYRKIASDLGYSRYDKFWQWDDRVKIYIYPDHEQFLKGEGIPRAWAQGVAKYDEKTIASFRWNENFLTSLVPHELTHLIFRDFVGFPASGGGIPLWIDEGVAQWEEKAKKAEAKEIARQIIKTHGYIPIRRLTTLDVRGVDDTALAGIFYAQSISVVGFLIEEYGGRRFTQFCRNLRDGKSVDASLSSAYGNSMSSVEDLERKWVKHYGGK